MPSARPLYVYQVTDPDIGMIVPRFAKLSQVNLAFACSGSTAPGAPLC